MVYAKLGYKTIVMKNLGIASSDMGGGGTDMEKGTGTVIIDATHKLMRK